MIFIQTLYENNTMTQDNYITLRWCVFYKKKSIYKIVFYEYSQPKINVMCYKFK